MSFTTLSLSSPWNYHIQQIDRTSSAFWEQRHWPPDPLRLQSMEIWRDLRRILQKIAAELLPGTRTLTPVETFLLHAAASLYETGWQTPYALQLPLKRRYIESGCLLRNSTSPGTILELSYLETATINALACICSAPGFDDLSSFPLSPEPVGQEEIASLRYLSALFQLADYLLIRRANKRTMPSLVNSATLDPLDARLLLQPYLPFVNIQSAGVTAFFELHPDDEHLATKMNALFEDPIRIWWERDSSWLQEQFQFTLTLHPPHLNIVQNAAAPTPLALTCPALIAFLEQYTSPPHQQPIIARAEPSLNDISTPSTPDTQKPITLPESTTTPQPTKPQRTRTFISYNHEDSRYLPELRKHLKPYNIDVWDATQIEPGAKWREEIDLALHTTKVAILLVSASFLASDFIVNDELPPLLDAARDEGAIILSVIIGTCAFNRSSLARFQTVNSPDRPLNLSRRRGERDIVWNQVAELVKDNLPQTP